jgi:hypothetical protein
MRALTRRAGVSLLFVTSLSLVAPAAHADDLLVMPYACTMVGGRPLLTRAPEQSYRIIGRREQRTHTACSPANPDMCRNWTVHRFDLECEGARVPWVSVVASVAEETTRRAWIEDGRLLLRMPPSWSFERDDPCARPQGFDYRFGFGRMRRYCADRRAMAPPPVVEMPFGFAPMLGIDGIFVKSSGSNTGPSPGPVAPSPPPVSALPPPAPPPKVARAEPAQPPRAEPAPLPAARPEPQPERAPKVAPAQTAPPPSAAVHAAPQPSPAAKSPSPPPHAPPPIAAAGAPVIPKIINRPDTASTDVPEQNRPSTTVPKADVPAPEPSRIAANPLPKEVVQPQAQTAPKADTEPSNLSITVSLLSVAGSPTTGFIAFVGLAVILLAAFALGRRRERLAGKHAHDIGSVSLTRARGQLVPAAGPHRPSAIAPSQSPPPAPTQHSAAQRTPPAWVDRIPQTRAEALQMLGIGVSRDATETAMKKIVDGLRLSWHPDLAKDEADRQLREYRLKQINTAWDLIQGKRLEHLDS